MKLKLFAFAILLLGCSGMSAFAEDHMPTVTTDAFTPSVTVHGVVQSDVGFFTSPKRVWYLRSFVDKQTHTVTHQLYFDLIYSGARWAFYGDAAADDSATPLQVQPLDRLVVACYGFDDCTFKETIGVLIPDAELRAKTASGFKVKTFAKDGNGVILEVTSEMIRKQLQVVDGLSEQLAKVARTAPNTTDQPNPN